MIVPPPPRRIIHVVATLGCGGTEVSCLALAREFAQRGVANSIVALRRGNGTIEEALAEIAGGAPRLLDGGRLARVRAFGTIVREAAPDAVIFHFFHIDHLALGAAARLAGVGRIAAKQGNPASTDPVARRKLRTIIHLTGVLGIRLVSASHWIEASLQELAPLPEGSRVVHNGCDVAAVGRRADAARAARADGEARIGMVARLDPIKDHKTLLAAVARLPERICGRTVRLELVGDGILREMLKAEAEQLGIAHRVTFAGARSDIPEQLGAWDAFVHATTRDEGFGVVLIEALAASTPVVASDVPACREVLQDGALGQLVLPGDATVLAQALAETLAVPQAVPDRAVVAESYDVTAMADRYLETLFADRGVHQVAEVTSSHGYTV